MGDNPPENLLLGLYAAPGRLYARQLLSLVEESVMDNIAWLGVAGPLFARW
jgi:hypothetical protein